MLTCQHCGYKGLAIGPSIAYVGGQGYVNAVSCLDRVACWQRWERRQTATPPERSAAPS